VLDPRTTEEYLKDLQHELKREAGNENIVSGRDVKFDLSPRTSLFNEGIESYFREVKAPVDAELVMPADNSSRQALNREFPVEVKYDTQLFRRVHGVLEDNYEVNGIDFGFSRTGQNCIDAVKNATPRFTYILNDDELRVTVDQMDGGTATYIPLNKFQNPYEFVNAAGLNYEDIVEGEEDDAWIMMDGDQSTEY
jgi:hypothetical protein